MQNVVLTHDVAANWLSVAGWVKDAPVQAACEPGATSAARASRPERQ